jgi:hypothetical protein
LLLALVAAVVCVTCRQAGRQAQESIPSGHRGHSSLPLTACLAARPCPVPLLPPPACRARAPPWVGCAFWMPSSWGASCTGPAPGSSSPWSTCAWSTATRETHVSQADRQAGRQLHGVVQAACLLRCTLLCMLCACCCCARCSAWCACSRPGPASVAGLYCTSPHPACRPGRLPARPPAVHTLLLLALQTDINDKPPNPDAAPAEARLKPRPKPWERSSGGGGSTLGSISAAGGSSGSLASLGSAGQPPAEQVAVGPQQGLSPVRAPSPAEAEAAAAAASPQQPAQASGGASSFQSPRRAASIFEAGKLASCCPPACLLLRQCPMSRLLALRAV